MLLVLLATATFVTNNKLFLKMQFCQNFTVLFLFCTWCPSFCYSANSISQVLTHIIYNIKFNLLIYTLFISIVPRWLLCQRK